MIEAAREARIREWLAADPDPVTRAEVEALLAAGDVPALAARFDGNLAFGTSGLRAPLGAGPRRMNRLVVRQIAAGLCGWLATSSGGPGDGRPVRVVVGRDARHGSAAFAVDIADVVGQLGGEPLVLPEPVPTPVLVWSTTELAADAAVMCTASHNPPSDNGCKIYVADGAQPVTPDDAELAATIAAVDPGRIPAPSRAPQAPLVAASVIDGYVAHVAGLVAPGPRAVRLVHTALHGVAWPVMARVLAAAGFDDVHPVAEQAEPDPDFPTTPYPNPEEAGALDLAVARARQLEATAVLANDPDGDRLAVAVPGPAGGDAWCRLSGDQLGWLLADHRMRRTSGPRLVVSTFETSRLLSRLAADTGVTHVEVPTGFKWIARAAMARPDLQLLLGYEEALGYSVDGRVHDKDGISAGLVAAELLAELAERGETVWDRLAAIARRVGHHATATRFWRLPDDRGPLEAAMDSLRSGPPSSLDGVAVTSVVDLASGVLGHPADAVVLELAGGARLVARPSGTEPKLKVYAEVVSPVDDAPGAFAAAERTGGAAAARLADALLAWLAGR